MGYTDSYKDMYWSNTYSGTNSAIMYAGT